MAYNSWDIITPRIYVPYSSQILKNVKDDMTSVVLQETLSAAGIYTHISDSNSQYKHSAENIEYTETVIDPSTGESKIVTMSVADKLRSLSKSEEDDEEPNVEFSVTSDGSVYGGSIKVSTKGLSSSTKKDIKQSFADLASDAVDYVRDELDLEGGGKWSPNVNIIINNKTDESIEGTGEARLYILDPDGGSHLGIDVDMEGHDPTTSFTFPPGETQYSTKGVGNGFKLSRKCEGASFDPTETVKFYLLGHTSAADAGYTVSLDNSVSDGTLIDGGSYYINVSKGGGGGGGDPWYPYASSIQITNESTNKNPETCYGWLLFRLYDNNYVAVHISDTEVELSGTPSTFSNVEMKGNNGFNLTTDYNGAQITHVYVFKDEQNSTEVDYVEAVLEGESTLIDDGNYVIKLRDMI